MPLAVTYQPLKALIPYARNSRTHPASQVAKLKGSLAEYGWTRPIAVADGTIVFGHGIVQAALQMAEHGIPIPRNEDAWQAPTVDLSHLSKAQRRAYVIADNRLALDSGWDEALLSIEMKELHLEGFDLSLTGFALPEIESLFEREGGGGDSGEDADAGSLLKLVNITIDEPRHKVEIGDHYTMAQRHHILCVSVLRDWQRWTPLLEGSAIFCPYPGPFVPYGKTAQEASLVMVQPDPYIAGHILDRYEESYGESTIAKVAS